MSFQDYRQFIDLCDQGTLEDRAKMVEFYLHNMALTDMNVWDPNARLGDLQLMALESWMNHEEARFLVSLVCPKLLHKLSIREL